MEKVLNPDLEAKRHLFDNKKASQNKKGEDFSMKRFLVCLVLVVSMVFFVGSSYSEEIESKEVFRCQVMGAGTGRYITPELMVEKLCEVLGYCPNYCPYEEDRCVEIYLLNTRVIVTNVFFDVERDQFLLPEFELPCEVIEQNEIITENEEDRYYITEVNSDDFTIEVISERKNGDLSVKITSHLPDEDGKSLYVVVHSADYEEECDDYRIPKKEFMQLWYDVYGI